MKKFYARAILCLIGVVILSGCGTIRRDDVQAVDRLRVGIASTQPPVIFRHNKQVSGVEADLARELSGAMGLQLVWVELKREDLIPALLDEKIDIIMSGMSITDARKIRIAFSEPYFETGQMALMRHSNVERYNSPERIKSSSARIGVQDGTTGDVFAQTQCPHSSRIRVGKPEDALYYFDGNRIDLFIYDAPVIMLMASQREADLVPLWRLLTKEELAWGLRREDSAMLEKVNGHLAEWRRSGRLDEIITKWMPYSSRLRE